MSIDQPPGTRKRNNDPREKPLAQQTPAEAWKLAQLIDESPSEPRAPLIYKDLAHDPDVLEVHERVTRLSEAASSDEERALIYNQQWGAFEKTHPEKAAAYKSETSIPEKLEQPSEDSVINYEEVSTPDATSAFHEVIEHDEEKAAEQLVAYRAAEEKAKQEVRDRLYNSSHAETMHFLAQEENGIEEPATLKEHLSALESLTKAYDEKVRAEKKQDAGTEEKKEHKKWSEMTPKERAITVGKWGGGIGGVAALAGVGIWANASILGSLGLWAPTTSAAVGLSMAGIGAGVSFVGSLLLADVFYFQLIKNLWTEGSAWLKKVSGGVLSGGGKGGHSAPTPKPGGGGGAAHH